MTTTHEIAAEKFQKLERDGMVAVLYSPGYGAGWSTWAGKESEAITFDAEIAQAVLDGDKEKATQIAARKYPDVYLGGAKDLAAAWLPKGEPFEIAEYDGSESVRYVGRGGFTVA